MDAPTPARDLTFDLLRGAAVLYIVGYYHIQEVWLVHLPGTLSGWLARVALALFCFLSGYFLSQRAEINHWAAAGRFYWRRLLKIYPLYLAALSAFVVLGLCPKVLFWPSALLINTVLNWNLLTLWFVSMIFLFYLLTPLYLFHPSIWKTGVLTVFLVGLIVLVRSTSGWIDPRIPPNLAAFAIGIGLTQSPRLRAAFFAPIPLVRVASLAILGAMFAGQFRTPPHDGAWTHAVSIVVWFIAALPWLIIAGRWLSGVIPVRVIEVLSTASFILYLSHRIIYHFGEEIYLAPTPILRQFFYLIVLLPVALGFSYFAQKAYGRLVK